MLGALLSIHLLTLKLTKGTAFESLRKGMEIGNGRNSPSQSISRMSGHSLSIQSLKLDDNITAKGSKSKRAERGPLPAMGMFTQKIADCAEEFGHRDGGIPDIDVDDDSHHAVNVPLLRRNEESKSREQKEDNYATMVIHPHKSSAIPQSQIKQKAVDLDLDRERKDVPFGGVDPFMDAQSTQTMIVKQLEVERSGKVEVRLNALENASSGAALLSEDSTESSEDDDRDPIDGSEEEEEAAVEEQRRRHKSQASDKSHHSRSMIITEDLSIAHLAASLQRDSDDTEND